MVKNFRNSDSELGKQKIHCQEAESKSSENDSIKETNSETLVNSIQSSNNLDSEFEKLIINPLEDELKSLKTDLNENGTKLETLDKSIQTKHIKYANELNNYKSKLSIYNDELNTYKNELVIKVNSCHDSGKNIVNSLKKTALNYTNQFYNYLINDISKFSLIFLILISIFGFSGLSNVIFGGNSTYSLGNNLHVDGKISSTINTLLLFLIYFVSIILLSEHFKESNCLLVFSL